MKAAAIFLKFRDKERVIKPIKTLDEIIAGCLNNDESCREWIYKSFYGYLTGVIRRYTSDIQNVEELVNDSYIKIFRKLQSFQHPEDPAKLMAAFKGWMAKIASRTVIDFLRIDKNQFPLVELTELHPVAEHLTVIDKMNAADVLKLLDELPQLQRVIFNLYEIEGFSHEEIAAELSITASHSRTYLARAKARLRTLYHQQTNYSAAWTK
ncbi:sigma-70 family RNA polymerase sigma factor [Pedobacter sp. HMF7647]|uniref:Sigma-70 family RNA polymerase sigma factor n=1 Tax=Hufsiella arboris TaxID=2695275 RepID=A0A7K1Y772_9SPHI|nr:RNA polymerase sigma factor [Hufsiella arboris]MXV50290.1 sigma-70 family RNA polymerase sigma factor [Hufsiella arboris]